MGYRRVPVQEVFEWIALSLDVCQFLVKLGVSIGFRFTVSVADTLLTMS